MDTNICDISGWFQAFGLTDAISTWSGGRGGRIEGGISEGLYFVSHMLDFSANNRHVISLSFTAQFQNSCNYTDAKILKASGF